MRSEKSSNSILFWTVDATAIRRVSHAASHSLLPRYAGAPCLTHQLEIPLIAAKCLLPFVLWMNPTL